MREREKERERERERVVGEKRRSKRWQRYRRRNKRK